MISALRHRRSAAGVAAVTGAALALSGCSIPPTNKVGKDTLTVKFPIPVSFGLSPRNTGSPPLPVLSASLKIKGKGKDCRVVVDPGKYFSSPDDRVAVAIGHTKLKSGHSGEETSDANLSGPVGFVLDQPDQDRVVGRSQVSFTISTSADGRLKTVKSDGELVGVYDCIKEKVIELADEYQDGGPQAEVTALADVSISRRQPLEL